MSYTSKSEMVKAAMQIATDVTEGTVQVDELEAAAVAECRKLFGTVYGPDDPLWEVHRDVTRQFLAASGMSAAELSEWTAVMRSREDAKPVSWIEQALADGADDEDDKPCGP